MISPGGRLRSPGEFARLEIAHLLIVMAGLVPAIHIFSPQDVDARDKPAHDR